MTLAHEIGHYVLHGEWLKQVWQLFDSIESWKQVIASCSEDDYEWLEAQAEEFASYLLTPEKAFDPFLKLQIDRVAKISGDFQADDLVPYLANPVGTYFGMSSSAAQARIRKSTVWTSFADKLVDRPS